MADSIQAKFEKFHNDNPQVYDALVRFAREAKAHGRTKIGIQLIAERVRWEVIIKTKSSDGFKISNSHLSRYARLIMEQEEDLKDFFTIRSLHRD